MHRLRLPVRTDPLRAFALFATLVGVTLLPAATRADTCQLKLISSLTLTEDGDHFLVPVTVAGSSRRLILELGDAFSGITMATAEQLSLKTETMPQRIQPRVGGETVTRLVKIPAIQLDRLTVRDPDILEIPSLAGADGILGLDILAANDLELDLAHDKLNLFSRDHCPGKVVYWNAASGTAEIPLTIQKSGNFLTEMALNGRKLRVAMETVGHSRMGMNVAHRVFEIDDHSPGLRVIATNAAGHPIYRYSFASLSVEGLEIRNPDIVISGNPFDPECDAQEHPVQHGFYDVSWCFGGADLFLGPSILRRLHLFFAFGEKMLYATAATD